MVKPETISIQEASDIRRKSLPGILEKTVDGEENVPKSSSLLNTYVAAFSVLLYMVVFGMVAAYPAQATFDMKKPGSRFRTITADEITWIASMPIISSAFGDCVAGYLTHSLGRKAVLILTTLPYLLSWLMVAYATSMAWIYCGRFISGICFGISSVAVPVYITEISTTGTRGFLLACYQTAFVFGILVVTCLGYVLRWSWLAASGAMVLTLGVSLLLFMPESPQWLIRESREKEAVKGLRFLRGKNVDIREELEKTSGNEINFSWKECLQPSFYKPTLIAILLMFFNQFSGYAAIIAYSVEIFHSTGSTIDPRLSSVILSVIQVLMTILSSLLMDRAGRRFLYLTSGIFIVIPLTVLGIYSILSVHNYDLSKVDWIPLLSLIVYIASFSLGFGTLPMLMASEMVPNHTRSVVLAITVIIASVFGFAVSKSFDFMVNLLGYHGVYWTYAAITLIGILYGWFCLPETKGRTISDINKSFDAK